MLVPLTSASGVNIRHAIIRALATANLAPREATWRVESARVWLDADRRVARGEVSLLIRKPEAILRWEPHELAGWINPDGDHAGMVVARLADPLFVDAWPVTWGRWAGAEGSVPEGIDPDHPRLELRHEEVSAWALAHDRRLPTLAEFQALWGPERFPWGDRSDPSAGRTGPVRYGEQHEVALHPPVRGLHDLGAWLWHWLEDGTVAGGVAEVEPVLGVHRSPALTPVGFRTVADP